MSPQPSFDNTEKESTAGGTNPSVLPPSEQTSEAASTGGDVEIKVTLYKKKDVWSQEIALWLQAEGPCHMLRNYWAESETDANSEAPLVKFRIGWVSYTTGVKSFDHDWKKRVDYELQFLKEKHRDRVRDAIYNRCGAKH